MRNQYSRSFPGTYLPRLTRVECKLRQYIGWSCFAYRFLEETGKKRNRSGPILTLFIVFISYVPPLKPHLKRDSVLPIVLSFYRFWKKFFA